MRLLKSITEEGLITLSRSLVCRPCFQGDGPGGIPRIVYLSAEKACPHHGSLSQPQAVNGALLYCFLQTVELNRMLHARLKRS